MAGVKLKLIVAASENSCIGKDNGIPWNLKKELAYFKKITTHTTNPDKRNAIVMGRVTWESIPEKVRPLPKRLNIILTRNQDYLKDYDSRDVRVFNDFNLAIESLQKDENIENIWIIGGVNIYKMAIEHQNCYRIYYTEILKYYDCDTFFPKISEDFELLNDHGNESVLVPMEKQVEDGIEYYYRIYQKINK